MDMPEVEANLALRIPIPKCKPIMNESKNKNKDAKNKEYARRPYPMRCERRGKHLPHEIQVKPDLDPDPNAVNNHICAVAEMFISWVAGLVRMAVVLPSHIVVNRAFC
jgi:hypothetical protein